jgi:hypothetical protein
METPPTPSAMEKIQEWVKLIQCEPYEFHVKEKNGVIYLQATYEEPDTFTGQSATQSTRKWQLSEYMTKSEVVQTALKCALTSAEHRVREAFQYQGQRVFGPHFDVDALWELAEQGRYSFRA